MTRPLGLHHLSVKELEPLDVVKVAAQCGYNLVSLFTNAPMVPQEGREGMFAFPTVTPSIKREMLERLADNGMGVAAAEFFLMTPDADLDAYRPGVAMGRDLGAKHLIAHVFDTDRARGVDTLGRFCDIAAEYDMKVGIEFCMMTPGCKTMHDAKWFVDQVGRDNLGFGICPMHLIRSGGTAADIAALDSRYLLYGQINDGHGLHVSSEYFTEVHDRELPGDGDFPLHDLLSALPASVPIEVKCPRDSRVKAGISAHDYARDLYARCRPLVDGLAPVR